MVHTLPDPEIVCLYVSQLAPGTDFVEVQRIIQEARRRHTGLGLRGAMVFDGERFAQLIAGRQALLESASAFIESDARMTGLRLLHRGSNPPTLPPRWSSGYCGPHDLDGVLAAGGGYTAVQDFTRLLADAEMD